MRQRLVVLTLSGLITVDVSAPETEGLRTITWDPLHEFLVGTVDRGLAIIDPETREVALVSLSQRAAGQSPTSAAYRWMEIGSS